MIYSVDDIRNRVEPIADKYNLNALYLFGSYARNEASDHSDIDFLVDTKGSSARGLAYFGLYGELESAFDGKEIDMIDVDALYKDDEDKMVSIMKSRFRKRVVNERIALYGNC